MKTDHILVIRFSAMGDVAMTVPVVFSLAKQYPDVRITVLSQKFAHPFFANMPHNVGFMEADLKKEYNGVTGLNALYRRLVAKNFTAVADLHDVLRSKYLRMRFSIDRYNVAHINKHRHARRLLTRQENKVLEQLPTPFQNYCDVFAQLGYPVEPDFSTIFGDASNDLQLLPETFQTKAVGERWIGIAPFAAHAGKIYPLDLMERTLKMLSERHPKARLLLFCGGKKETEVVNRWSVANANIENASSQLGGLANELVLMSHLDVMLSMDSSNMHLASLVGTPVVSVWGATHPYAGFMGWGQKMENAVMLDLPCRPCSIYGKKACAQGDYPCLKGITPEMIIAKIERVIR